MTTKGMDMKFPSLLVLICITTIFSYPCNANAQRTITYFEKNARVVEVWCNSELMDNKAKWPVYQDIAKILAKDGWKKVPSPSNGTKYGASIEADLMMLPFLYEQGEFKPRHKKLVALKIILFKPAGGIDVFLPIDYDSLEHNGYDRLISLLDN